MPDKKLTDNIKTTDWLVKGISKEQLDKERIQALKEQIEYLEAENERLTNAYKQVAWERDVFAEDMRQEIKKDCSYLMLDIKTIKSEAYKEFAEKIEERIAVKILKDKSNEYAEGFVDALDGVNGEIDNLLKEIIGE